MELEKITTAVRPRSPWEAIDLGFHLGRRWWKTLLLPWVVTVTGAAATLFYLLSDWPMLALFLFWLFKPLYDRVPLYVLSRALFNAAPSWRESLAALPRLLTRDLPWTLLRRTDFARAFNLPVRQLEGLRGKASRRRMQLLQRRTRGHASSLLFMFLGLEYVVFLSMLWLMPLLLPDNLADNLSEWTFEAMRDQTLWVQFASVLYLLTVLVLEPFYVATGFALYLNRRTLLEAWDIELCFRRMSRRLTGGLPAALLTGVLIGFSGALPQTAMAEPVFQRPEVHSERREMEASAQVIEEVMQLPEFDGWRTEKSWRYIGEEEQREIEPFDLSVGLFMARLVEFLLWGTLCIALILLFIHREKWLHLIRRTAPKPAPPAPEQLFGLDIRPESLPENVPEQAMRLWREGRQREAMSLLYRGALAALVHKDGIAFSQGDTECDCLRILQPKAPPDLFDHFEGLTRVWQSVAYAHRLPGEEQVKGLCDHWERHYGAPP